MLVMVVGNRYDVYVGVGVGFVVLYGDIFVSQH